MKKRRKVYRLTIEDENRLVNVWNVRFTQNVLYLLLFGILLLFIIISCCLVAFSPIRNLLPGYMKTGEREQMVRALMRIDSLEEGYKEREGFIKNVISILDSGRAVASSNTMMPVNMRELEIDLLKDASEEEKAFVKMMDERERYNLSVLNPAAADGLLFVDIAPGSIVSETTKGKPFVEVIIPKGSDIYADADGTVTECRYTSAHRGYEIEIHHARGYMTHYYGVGTPLVRKGEKVSAGQAIASSSDKRGIGNTKINLEIWRDGEALLPSTIIWNQ